MLGFLLIVARWFDFGQTLANALQFGLQRTRLILQELFLRFRIHRRRCWWSTETLPPGHPRSVVLVTPTPAAETVAPTTPRSRNGEVAPSPCSRGETAGCSGAIPPAPPAHWSHSLWSCSVTSWHGLVLPAFEKNRCLTLVLPLSTFQDQRQPDRVRLKGRDERPLTIVSLY